jgi:uncharacterized protein with NRDE domain
MCLVLIAYDLHPRYPLILAANRDEFYERPTAAAGYWDDAPNLFAGRDLVHCGTWLGISRTGRLAALTNYREPHAVRKDAPSRGKLVSDFLKSATTPEEYLTRLRGERLAYLGYNLLLGDLERLYCYSNKNDQITRLTRGVHGLSNHLLDTPWPKVLRGRDALARVVTAGDFTTEDLFVILADTTKAPDEQLPDTGIGLERERLLSSIFITSPVYGTRSSSVLLIDSDRQVSFVERSFNDGEARDVEVRFEISALLDPLALP